MANTEGSEAIAEVAPMRESKPLTFAHRRSTNMTAHVEAVREKVREIQRQLTELEQML